MDLCICHEDVSEGGEGGITCMAVDLPLLAPTYAIHRAWQLCQVPTHQPMAIYLKINHQYLACDRTTYLAALAAVLTVKIPAHGFLPSFPPIIIRYL